jgi:thiamine kinase-like enzyme
LQSFGVVEIPNSEFCWLFLEDAGNEAYLPNIQRHRMIASKWLSVMHTQASQLTSGSHLPDRGPTHYLEHLKNAQNTILQDIDNKSFNYDDLKILESIISLLNILKLRWKEVEQFFDQIPRTLVHCDFVSKNVRIRNEPAGEALMPFDWESAGWGAPAIDIKDVDISTYWSAINNVWPNINLQIIQELAFFGNLFQYLAAINWDSGRLKYQWVDRGMWRMKYYESMLSDLLQAANWRI